MRSSRWYSLSAVLAVVFLTALAMVWIGCSSEPTVAPVYEPADLSAAGAAVPVNAADVAKAMSVQNRHTTSLEANDGVFGTATGRDAQGRAIILVLAERPDVRGVPATLEGVPVRLLVTPRPELFAKPGGGTSVNFKERVARPVPVGYSVGNYMECAAGTYGARVTRGGNIYALSNNHVFARQNAGSPGEIVGQPGLYDNKPQCSGFYADTIGSLADFVPVQTGTNANNTVDCAIVLSSASFLSNSTPAGFYGVPSATAVQAALDLPIQKVGRTSGRTTGTVIGINATVTLAYAGANTRFVDQVLTSSGFSKSGDSGSLIVTNDATANPVALLFAGNRQGYTWGNRIQNVLSGLNIAIDGD